MNSNKSLLAGIAGGVVLFLLGYLIYGMLLADFMKTHAGTATGVARNPSEYMLWLIGVANLIYGFMLVYIFGKAGISTAGSGFATGAIVGLLTSASTDCINYATTNLLTGSGMAADIVSFAVLSGVAGAVIGWVKGTGKKAAA
ncbi:MAG TPA: hypothetical protein VKR53_12695 [Puia sp.]|nr:hypothetical protein [Puia sp.]